MDPVCSDGRVSVPECIAAQVFQVSRFNEFEAIHHNSLSLFFFFFFFELTDNLADWMFVE